MTTITNTTKNIPTPIPALKIPVTTEQDDNSMDIANMNARKAKRLVFII
jgi:hypothetical protein